MKVKRMIEQLECYNCGECAKNNPISLHNVKMLLDELSDEDLISDWKINANECGVFLNVYDENILHSGYIEFYEDGTICFSANDDGIIASWKQKDSTDKIQFSIPAIKGLFKRWEQFRRKVYIGCFEDLLEKTGRRGVERLINVLRTSGFYKNQRLKWYYEGGFLMYSVQLCDAVYEIYSKEIKQSQYITVDKNSFTIVTLLHDIWRLNEVPFYANLPIENGEKTVIMLLRMGLELTDKEITAIIRYHKAYAEQIQKQNQDATPSDMLFAVANALLVCLAEPM